MRAASIFFFFILLFYGWVSFQRNSDYTDIKSLWEPVLTAFPDYPRALSILSNYHMIKGHHDKALDLGEKAMRLQPYDASMYRAVGNIYSMKQEWKKARPYYQQSTMLLKHWKAFELLSITLLHLNHPAEALRTVQKSRRLEPLRPATALLEAGIHRVLGNHTQVARCVDEAESLGITASRHRQIGEILSRINRPKAAVSFFECALEKDPKDTASLLALGKYNLDKNQYKQAHNYFIRILSIKPNDCRARLLIAETFHRGGLYRKAAEIFSAFALPNRTTHFNAGLNYLYAGDSANAIKYFSLVLEANPENLDATLNMGIAFMIGNKLEKALPWLKKARRMKPDSPRIWTNLGDYYSRKGDLSQAQTSFRKAILLDPAHVKARLMYANFLCRKVHKTQEAIAVLKKGLDLLKNPEEKKQLQDEIWIIMNAGRKEDE